MKLTKADYISFLIETKGYTEEEAREIIAIYGVIDIDKEAQEFYA